MVLLSLQRAAASRRGSWSRSWRRLSSLGLRRSYITKLMNTKIDTKSALVGLVIGVLVALGIAAASSPGSVGRYQIAGTGSHGMVLDTATGQVWSTFLSSSGGRTDGNFYDPKIDLKK